MKIPENCWGCPMQRYSVRSDNHICVITGKLAEEIEERSAFCPIKAELPKNATNGDVIKAMFPRNNMLVNEFLGEKGTVFFESEDNVILYSLDWWNAPYRREE
jgi:hypothetical protein